MAAPEPNVKAIFDQALEIESAGEREAYLAQACAGDLGLRHKIDALLIAYAEAGSFLETAAAIGVGEPKPTADYQDKDEHVGVVIAGKYTLVEPIGEGGMGAVWRAKQTEPVKRFVAVKLIKTGMDTKQVLARFEAERQALALMDHPNIAKVLDGGLHQGRPYFVMELVKGAPITDYCDKVKLTPRDRLELFVPVCQAIQHAHQKGIIHRDIKPSNVLVALYDDKPVVKVIDFGVAKATGGTLTEATIETGFGGVVGTPQYMSPEQATFNNLDIDTRSDVYALGVLLYELLTGSPPFSKQELEKRGLLEMLRVVREEEPPRPSNRLSTADALPTLSANRGTEPKRLTGLLRNELDWIVMKALEKDRTRRYETANGFAADVLRYLSGEAVHAHPPNTAYRLRKFVRRHKGQVLAASLVLFALLAGIVGTTFGLVEANRAQSAERDRAEGERLAKLNAQEKEKLAVGAADKERAARLDEERQRKFAEAIAAFVQKDFLALTSVEGQLRFGGEGKEGLSKDTTLGELLDRAADKLRAQKDLDPRIEAELCWIVGVSYHGSGETRKGIVFLERAVQLLSDLLGRDHHGTLNAMNSLAVSYGAVGKANRAVPLFEETLRLHQGKLGPDHPNTLMIMSNLASAYQDAGELERALPLFEESLKLMKARLGPDDYYTLINTSNLAKAYTVAGKFDRAVPLFEETLKREKAKLGPGHPNTLITMNNLASAYRAAGKHDQALPLFEETVEFMKAKLGSEHLNTVLSMGALAEAYQSAGKHDQALPILEEAVKLLKAKLGPDDRNTLSTMNNLAKAYWLGKQLDKSIPLFEEILKRDEAKFGRDHPDTFLTMANLGVNYLSTGKLDLALPLLQETLKLRKVKLGAEHLDTIVSMGDLAEAYLAAKQFDRALPLYEEVLKLRKAKLGPDHHDTLVSMNNLAALYWSAMQLDKSIPLLEETLKRREAKFGRNHAETLRTLANLGVNYKDAGRVAEALPLLEEAHRASKKHVSLRFVGPQLLDAYAKAGERRKFTELLREQVLEARKALPKDSPQLAGLLAQSGMTLLEVNGFAGAEPLLREALAIREKQEPDDWRTFNTRSMLGGALLGQKKYADAEPLLVKGYDGIKAREKTIPPQAASRIPEAIERLIEFYTATNKPDDVTKWKAERAKYPSKPPITK
jgi:eukaryotic-like serine/threonine-protein kinase